MRFEPFVPAIILLFLGIHCLKEGNTQCAVFLGIAGALLAVLALFIYEPKN